jgi:hypothetical protein
MGQDVVEQPVVCGPRDNGDEPAIVHEEGGELEEGQLPCKISVNLRGQGIIYVHMKEEDQG